jgi:hypothetical protein
MKNPFFPGKAGTIILATAVAGVSDLAYGVGGFACFSNRA